MTNRRGSKANPRPETKRALTRRQLLSLGATLGAAGALKARTQTTAKSPDPMSEEVLIGASELSGEALTRERVRAMKPLLEFNLTHLRILREFDPDEEEPLTEFRL